LNPWEVALGVCCQHAEIAAHILKYKLDVVFQFDIVWKIIVIRATSNSHAEQHEPLEPNGTRLRDCNILIHGPPRKSTVSSSFFCFVGLRRNPRSSCLAAFLQLSEMMWL
jgi:hypothetical protein